MWRPFRAFQQVIYSGSDIISWISHPNIFDYSYTPVQLYLKLYCRSGFPCIDLSISPLTVTYACTRSSVHDASVCLSSLSYHCMFLSNITLLTADCLKHVRFLRLHNTLCHGSASRFTRMEVRVLGAHLLNLVIRSQHHHQYSPHAIRHTSPD